MKTITRKIIALAIIVIGIIFSDSAMAACSKPTVMSTTAITASAATFNWNSVSGALNYNIRYRVVSTTTWTTVNAITALNYSASGLTASTSYEWQVQTRCSSTQISQWTNSVTFSTIACVTPSGLNATGVTAFDATLNWAAASGAVGYNVQYRIVGATSWTSTTSSSASVTISALSPVTNYEFQVQTNCGGSNLSAFSSSATFTTLVIPCNVPASLTASGITSDFASLDWNDVQYAVGYNAQYRQVGSSTWIAIPDQGGSSADINGLLPNTNYEWQVQTDCGNSNTSAFSSTVSFSTTQILCTTPALLTVMDITTTTATLKWDAVAGAVGYNVEYRAVGAPSWTVTSTTATNVLLSSLTPGAPYEWQVQTDCGSSNFSAFSVFSNFTTASPVVTCVAPVGLSASNILFTSATLSWLGEPDVKQYTVQYREVGASSWTTVTAQNSSVTISALTNPANYEWQVQKDCGFSNISSFSATSTFSIGTAPVCGSIPSGLNVTGMTPTTATLNWSGGANAAMASGYDVRYREMLATSWSTVTTTGTSVTLSSLASTAAYEWQVRTDCGGAGISPYSTAVSFSMLSHVPVNTTQYVDQNNVPNPNDMSTWNVIILSSGNATTDAQIVHDWLVAHGCIIP